jgi:NAD(P)-dependent dehydrogenase (short-subunit alcohol dehydrogenase family)
MSKKPLSEQVLVVTGASSGLGRPIAHVSRANAARRSSSPPVTRWRSTTASPRSNGQARTRWPFPATSPTARWSSAASSAVERFGRIDRYVANAIVTIYAEAERLEEDELRRVWDVNFFGVVYGYWAALPHLRASPGTFLHIRSALAYRGIPLQAAYCSSKAGLRAFFESARVEEQKAGSGVAARPPGRDQHTAVRPRPPEDRVPARARAFDLPAGAVRRGCAALRRAPGPRTAALLGGAEAPLGSENVTKRRRLGAQAQRLEEPAHRRAEACRLPGHPLRYAAR